MNPHEFNPAEADKPVWHSRADMALTSLLAARRLSTYGELAEASGITPPHRIHKLTLWLEETMRQDAEAGLPVRAAVVISKQRGMPAPGFFAQAKALGLYEGPEKGPEAAAFHQACLDALFT